MILLLQQSRNEITITPVQSTSMSTTFQQKPSISSNIPVGINLYK